MDVGWDQLATRAPAHHVAALITLCRRNGGPALRGSHPTRMNKAIT